MDSPHQQLRRIIGLRLQASLKEWEYQMFHKMKIAARLLVGFGVLMLLLAGIAGFSVYSGQSSQQAVADLMRIKSNEVLEQQVEKEIYLGRLHFWRLLARGETADYDKAEDAFRNSQEIFSELMAKTIDPARRAKLEDLGRNIATYKSGADRFKEIKGHNPNADTPEALVIFKSTTVPGNNIEIIGKDLSDSYGKAAKERANTTLELISTVITVSWIIGVISILAGGALAFAIGRGISNPINAMTTSMTAMAEGNLSVEVKGFDNDKEFGPMAHAIAVFRENALERARLEETARSERQHELQRQSVMEGLISRFRILVAEVVTAMGSETGRMKGTARTLTDVAFRADQTAGSARNAAADSSVNIQTVSVAAEELTASINEISSQIRGASKRASQATEIARQTDHNISSLVDISNRVGAVVEMIRTIAQQTNLLALNATIEAARAGDAGKGFAVVASEVKTLAGHTAKATDEIAAQITAIQEATQQAVTDIRAITVAVGEIDSMTNAVAASVEQQSEATGEIARAISQASASSKNASTDVEHVASVIGETNTEAGRVTDATGLLVTSTNRLAEAVEGFLTDLSQDVKNRRDATRRLSTEAVVIQANGARAKTKLIDISDTGAKVVATVDFGNSGDRVILEFEDQTSAPAKLVWLKDGFAGVQFDQPLRSRAEARAA
jgi:methyl-accepting chemotaxis protein